MAPIKKSKPTDVIQEIVSYLEYCSEKVIFLENRFGL